MTMIITRRTICATMLARLDRDGRRHHQTVRVVRLFRSAETAGLLGHRPEFGPAFHLRAGETCRASSTRPPACQQTPSTTIWATVSATSSRSPPGQTAPFPPVEYASDYGFVAAAIAKGCKFDHFADTSGPVPARSAHRQHVQKLPPAPAAGLHAGKAVCGRSFRADRVTNAMPNAISQVLVDDERAIVTKWTLPAEARQAVTLTGSTIWWSI